MGIKKWIKRMLYKSPTQVIESVDHPELESFYVKRPRERLKHVSDKEGRFRTSVLTDFEELSKYVESRPGEYTDLHTHPSSFDIPSGHDIFKFLCNKKLRTRIIASTDSSSGKVKGYFFLRKTKKTPEFSLENKDQKLTQNLTSYGIISYGGFNPKVPKDGNLADALKFVSEPQSTPLSKIPRRNGLNSFFNKYHLQYRFVPAEGYTLDEHTLAFKKKDSSKSTLAERLTSFIFLLTGLFFLALSDFTSTGNVTGNSGFVDVSFFLSLGLMAIGGVLLFKVLNKHS